MPGSRIVQDGADLGANREALYPQDHLGRGGRVLSLVIPMAVSLSHSTALKSY